MKSEPVLDHMNEQDRRIAELEAERDHLTRCLDHETKVSFSHKKRAKDLEAQLVEARSLIDELAAVTNMGRLYASEDIEFHGSPYDRETATVLAKVEAYKEKTI